MQPALEHQQKTLEAIGYIREHIDAPMTAADVAKAVYVSEYHFHRIFKATMGETLGQYITRKKLESAAISLLYGQYRSITDLAHQYGYASVSSFSKAFASWFGCRPTELAAGEPSHDAGRLSRHYNKALSSPELWTENQSDTQQAQSPDALVATIDAKVEIRTIEAFDVYGLTSQGGYDLQAVEETWQAFRERLEDRGIDWNSQDRFAINHDHPGLLPKAHCRYDACIKRGPQLPDDLPFLRMTIPAGRYAIYPCKGPPEAVLDQYIAFYSQWLPQSDYMPDDFPVLDHCIAAPWDGHIIELWAKIKRKSSF